MKYRDIKFDIVLCVMVGIFLCYFAMTFVVKVSNENYLNTIISDETSNDLRKSQNDDILNQTFIIHQKYFTGISIVFKTVGKVQQSDIVIEIRNVKSKKKIYDWKLDACKLKESNIQKLLTLKPIKIIPDNQYECSIKIDSKNKDSIGVYISQQDRYVEGQAFLNNQLQTGDLAITVFGCNVIGIVKITYALLVMAILVVLIAVCFCLKKQYSVEKILIIEMILFGLIYIGLMPAFSAPDEGSHFISAYKLSSKIMFQKATDDQGRVLVRSCDIQNRNYKPGQDSYDRLLSDINFFQKKPYKMVPSEDIEALQVVPYVYLPQSIGIAVGRIFHLNYNMLIFLGRFFNLLCFTGMIYISMKLFMIKRMFIFVMCMFPMTLELMSSFSYDTFCIGLSIIFVAYILRLAYIKEKISYKDTFICVLLVTALSAVKLVYIALLGMCLIIPKIKFGSGKRYSLNIVLALSTIAVLLGSLFSLLRLNNIVTNKVNMLTWANQRGYTLTDILYSPKRSILLFLRTIKLNLVYYIEEMIGGRLGWLEIHIPKILVLSFFVILILTLFCKEKVLISIEFSQKAILAIVFFASAFLILLGMLLSFTPIRSNLILGVQGRYFLPILPLIGLILHSKRYCFMKNIEEYIIVSVVVLNVFTVVSVYSTIITR